MANKTISKPPLISYAEFKKKLCDSDGFRKSRRIIFYDPNGKFPYQYRVPIIGPKEYCYKVAYYLLFLAQDESDRNDFIQEGEFKHPISFNFARAWEIYEGDKADINRFHKDLVNQVNLKLKANVNQS